MQIRLINNCNTDWHLPVPVEPPAASSAYVAADPGDLFRLRGFWL